MKFWAPHKKHMPTRAIRRKVHLQSRSAQLQSKLPPFLEQANVEARREQSRKKKKKKAKVSFRPKYKEDRIKRTLEPLWLVHVSKRSVADEPKPTIHVKPSIGPIIFLFFGEGEGSFYCVFCKFQHRRDASTSRVSAIEKENILAKCIAGFVERGAGGRAVRTEVIALAGLAATLSEVLDATNDDQGLIFGSQGEIL